MITQEGIATSSQITATEDQGTVEIVLTQEGIATASTISETGTTT